MQSGDVKPRTKRRGTVLWVVIGAIVVVAGAAGIAWALTPRSMSADDAAYAYLDALAAGDYDAIAPLLADAPFADEDLQTLEASFRGATEYISDPRIEEVTRESTGLVSVRASATLDGQKRDVSFVMGDTGGEWRLTSEFLGAATIDATIGLETPLASAWLGNRLVPAGTPIGLLPARYEVSAAPRGIVEGSGDVAVATDRERSVRIHATLTDEGSTRAQEQIDAYVAECTRPADEVPDGCGIFVPWAVDLATLDRIAYRVEKTPAVTLNDDARTFDATGGVLVATVYGTARDGSSGAFTYRADDWALRGSVRFEDDEMVLAVW